MTGSVAAGFAGGGSRSVSFRTILILVNLVAIAALVVFIVFRVVSLRRNPHHRDPENLTPFFDDDVLEGAHLERVARRVADRAR